MKLIKTLGKAAFALTALLYSACLYNGITFFEYTSTDDGGILSIAGHDLEINTNAANTFWETYSQAEEEAAKYLPEKVSSAIKRLSQLLPN